MIQNDVFFLMRLCRSCCTCGQRHAEAERRAQQRRHCGDSGADREPNEDKNGCAHAVCEEDLPDAASNPPETVLGVGRNDRRRKVLKRGGGKNKTGSGIVKGIHPRIGRAHHRRPRNAAVLTSYSLAPQHRSPAHGTRSRPRNSLPPNPDLP